MPAPQRHSPSQIEETAKQVWKMMVEACLAAGLPRVDHEYGSGYLLEGNLAMYVRQAWPGTNIRKGPGKTASNLLRQFLKNTGNVVVLPYNGKRPEVFVRAQWAYRDAIPVVVGAALDRREAIAAAEREHKRKEAKVTPEEAGETLPPAPVQQRKGDVVSHPVHGKGEKDSTYPNIIRFTNGYSQCTTCGHVFEKRTGISSHVSKHIREGVTQEVDRLRDEVASLRLQVHANVKALDPSSALTVVGDYIQMIKDECARLEAENEELRRRPVGDPEAEAKIELVREVLAKVQQGETSMMRGLSDINDAMEA